MALWDKLRGELIDIIEWLDDTRDTMVYRFQRYDNEIKYGAKLIVREGQVAAFVNEGRLAFFPTLHIKDALARLADGVGSDMFTGVEVNFKTWGHVASIPDEKDSIPHHVHGFQG